MLKLWYTMLTKNTSNSISGWFSEIFNLADVSFCGHFCKIVPLPRPQLGALTRFHTLRCGSPHLKLSRSLLIALNYVEYVTFYIMNISLPPSRWMKFWTARDSPLEKLSLDCFESKHWCRVQILPISLHVNNSWTSNPLISPECYSPECSSYLYHTMQIIVGS